MATNTDTSKKSKLMVRLPEPLKMELQEHARSIGEPTSAIVRQLIREHLRKATPLPRTSPMEVHPQ